MPLRSDYAEQSCSLARALEVLGERWTLLIVRDAFHGLGRYDEFVRSLGSKVSVLHEGRILCEGSMDKVQNDSRVIEVYLGRDSAKGNA